MRFKGLDLNLLAGLLFLIEERSVSRAAERARMTQPAMSSALARLRTYFEDPLLVAHGKKMVPTPLALKLHAKLRGLILEIDTIISDSVKFDPSTSRREFKICMSDYMASAISPSLVRTVRPCAPDISFNFLPASEETPALLDKGMIDILIMPEEYASPAHVSIALYEGRHVLAGCRDNPVFAGGPHMEDFLCAGHVAVEIGQIRPASVIETHLRRLGIARRIEARVSSFLLAVEMVVNTDLLTIMYEPLFRIYAERVAIACCDLPFRFPSVRHVIQHHTIRRDDEGLRWLIGQIKTIVSQRPF